jgi:hypothetical protein
MILKQLMVIDSCLSSWPAAKLVLERVRFTESLHLLIVMPLAHFRAPGREISRLSGLFAAAVLLAPDSKLALGLYQIRNPCFPCG